MSRSLLTAVIVAAVAFGPAARAAVVITALSSQLEIRDDFFGRYDPVDVDGDGTVDFTFGSNSSAIGIQTERSNRIVIRIDPPPNIGGPPTSLPPGYALSSTLVTEGFGDFSWASSDYLGGYVSPGENAYVVISIVLSTGSASDFNGRGGVGFEFHAQDGIHYGYFDINASKGYAGLTLYGWAYESQPGVAILVGQVPEPSALVLVGLASDSSFFISMFWYFYKELEPHLQRAHAGHTQDAAGQQMGRPCSRSVA